MRVAEFSPLSHNVVPAKAGTQIDLEGLVCRPESLLDSRFRGNDGMQLSNRPQVFGLFAQILSPAFLKQNNLSGLQIGKKLIAPAWPNYLSAINLR